MAHREAELAALLEQVCAETSDAGKVIGEIYFALVFKALLEVNGRDGRDDFVQPLLGGIGGFGGDEFAVDAVDDGGADLEMNVGGVAFNTDFENFVEQFHAASLAAREIYASGEWEDEI